MEASYIIQDSITKIEAGVFNECSKLETAVIPEGVVEIGKFLINKKGGESL